jgi:hypothetical protein
LQFRDSINHFRTPSRSGTPEETVLQHDKTAVIECPINMSTAGVMITIHGPDRLIGQFTIPASDFSKKEDKYQLRHGTSDQSAGEVVVKIERYQSIQDDDTY